MSDYMPKWKDRTRKSACNTHFQSTCWHWSHFTISIWKASKFGLQNNSKIVYQIWLMNLERFPKTTLINVPISFNHLNLSRLCFADEIFSLFTKREQKKSDFVALKIPNVRQNINVNFYLLWKSVYIQRISRKIAADFKIGMWKSNENAHARNLMMSMLWSNRKRNERANRI